MTPLYDVLTVQPMIDSGQLRHNRFKLAISVGNHNHYRIDIIQKRHFLETADAAGLPCGTVETLCDEIEAAYPVVRETMAKLAGGIIRDELIDSVIRGIRSRLETLLLAV
jgi:serine/threonine-protein kinase HipA